MDNKHIGQKDQQLLCCRSFLHEPELGWVYLAGNMINQHVIDYSFENFRYVTKQRNGSIIFKLSGISRFKNRNDLVNLPVT